MSKAPTQAQIDAAHDAWRQIIAEWQLRRTEDMWLLERRIDSYEPDYDWANAPAYHRFTGPGAERQARFALRDKCVRAMLAAALSVEPTPTTD